MGIAEGIRDWHASGNHWRDIGYHWVIRHDRTVEKAKNIRPGDICLNHNADSIGVCMVGGKHKGD